MKSYEAMKPLKIHTANGTIEAEMLLDMLHSNQIPAFRQGVGSAAIMDIYGTASTFGEDIYVDEADVKKAVELIEVMLSPGEDA